jgi:hypothetical protein
MAGPVRVAGPINTASPVSAAVWTDPNTKACGRLPFLVVCHSCRPGLRTSLCQAVFSNKSAHVLASISESRSTQDRKSKSKKQSLHHRMKSISCTPAGSVAIARNDRMTTQNRQGGGAAKLGIAGCRIGAVGRRVAAAEDAARRFPSAFHCEAKNTK